MGDPATYAHWVELDLLLKEKYPDISQHEAYKKLVNESEAAKFIDQAATRCCGDLKQAVADANPESVTEALGGILWVTGRCLKNPVSINIWLPSCLTTIDQAKNSESFSQQFLYSSNRYIYGISSYSIMAVNYPPCPYQQLESFLPTIQTKKAKKRSFHYQEIFVTRFKEGCFQSPFNLRRGSKLFLTPWFTNKSSIVIIM
ncbi:hypothetical protein BO71DRAFT_397336 [Aspergillus ellipticus CBS 707.79]|uniref:Uncharacterized protein n=1 Tax=Aspergillus ellipticus CBS 707.79 TaxID=1448320 RepID=A0A319DFT0_9EURO|nr:hypothetical protein BO71DRAFT_397336 [Aspergillus ellipticus CBS 707.79]